MGGQRTEVRDTETDGAVVAARLKRGYQVDAGLVVVALAIAGGYLWLGVGNVMDDWYTLHHAHFDGAWRAAGEDQLQARPVASVVYAFVFGLLGRTIAPTIILMALANAGSAVLLRRLATVIAPTPIAAVTAFLWLVLPTTTSLEAWASASNISLALCCALGALWIAARSPVTVSRLVVCVSLAAVAVLAYEVVVVLLGGIAAGLLLLDRDRPGTLRWGVLAGTGAAFAWMVTHWHPNKRVTSAWGDVGQVFPGNYTWGIAPRPVGLAIGVVVLVLSVLVLSGVIEGRSWREARIPLVCGWALVIAGVVPFLKYTYAPIGAGDRANTVSSIGAAVVLASIIWAVGRGRTGAVAFVTVVLVAVSLHPRLLMMRSWSLGGDDADRIIEAIREDAPGADLVVLGPSIVARNGVTAMQHADIFEDAVQLVLDDTSVRGEFPDDVDRFDVEPGVRLDVREIIRKPREPGRR